jgi:hypothetical protein
MGAGGGTVLVVVVEVVVEVVGATAGGDAVAEQEAMKRQTAGATRASLSLDMRRPLTVPISKAPLTSCNQRA